MSKLIEIMGKVIRVVCAIVMAIISIAVFTQVIARFVFNAPIFWIEEFAIDLMIWLVFLGSAMAVANRSHTRITFFINLLGEKARSVVEIFTQFVCLAFILYISWHAVGNVSATMKNLTTALRVPRGLLYASLPVSGILIAFYYVLNIIQDIKQFGKGSAKSDVQSGEGGKA